LEILKRVLIAFLILITLAVLAAGCTGGYLWYVWSSNLPYVGVVEEYRPPIITEIYSMKGETIGRFWDEKRMVVPLEQMPGHLIHAFVAAEDSRFFKHEGVDIKSIFRAFLKNISAGKIEQGGSTITQQVTKSLLLKNTERTYRRKVREAILSVQLEKTFSKERILFLYLNQIYLGQGAYGVEAAARTYFNKSVGELDISESAILAGLPQAPARYSPVKHFELAKKRQLYVLERMLKEGYISEGEHKKALNKPLLIQEKEENTFSKAPYFTEYVRKYLEERYGRDFLYREGLKVYTTLDLSMQRAAKKALGKGLLELDKREGYRGPLKSLSIEEIDDYDDWSHDAESGSIVKALVVKVDDAANEVVLKLDDKLAHLGLANMKWARKPDKDIPYYAGKVRMPSAVLDKGDLVLVRILEKGAGPFAWEVALEQLPEIQGALFCVDPETCEVKAMVGGRDFYESQFNRAVQSRRQPGSAFKPFIYSAALDWGMTPATVILDSAFIAEQAGKDELWKPKNYKEKFFGPTLLRTGIIKSRNVITVKILKKIGVQYAVKYAKAMGIGSDLSPNLSLALGSSGISLMELTRAYSVFANGGKLGRPTFIRRVLDRSGQVIEEKQPEIKEVISEETAAVMTELLKGVIREGTGWRIKALKRPAAGKTGTTNNLLDAWFMGFTPDLVTGVWVGYDDLKPMGKGETGSRAASPIWLYFMEKAHEGRPIRDFKVPKGVVFAKIDSKTGLLAAPHSKKAIFQAFRQGKEPKEHSPEPYSPKSGQFLQYDMGN